MMKLNKMKLFGMILGILLPLTSTHGAQASLISGSAGVKGAVGGNYLSEPDGATGMVGIFTDGGGGVGGGGGIFGEIRLLNDHLGLEVDLLLDANKTWCDYNSVDFIIKYTDLRIPVLVKASTTKGILRLGVGIGPEIRIGLSASTEMDAPNNVDVSALTFTAVKRNDVALAWELAFAINLKIIEITLDARFSANLTLPKEYFDRNHFANANSSIETEAAHSVDARILAGVAYVF